MPAVGSERVFLQKRDATEGIRDTNSEGRRTIVMAEINGTTGNDFLLGTLMDDDIFGDAGDDTLHSLAGNDSVEGGDGSDKLFGGNGEDSLYAGLNQQVGPGSFAGDTLDNIINYLYGGKGDDQLFGSSAKDFLYGGEGNDTANGFFGEDYVSGGKGNDSLNGGEGNDTIVGGDGDDILEELVFRIAGGNDFFFGGNGNDFLDGGTENDILVGGNGNDTLRGAGFLNVPPPFGPGLNNIDTLIGGQGEDTFLLGDSTSRTRFYYDDGLEDTVGTTDYALITDFSLSQDVVQLAGTSADYSLGSSPSGLSTGTAIFLDKPAMEPDELIGILQGIKPSSLSLDGSYFSYV